VTDNKLLHLKIKQIRQEASGIHSFELVSEDGNPLPPFDAGSHLDLHLPSGIIRQYSLSNDPAEINGQPVINCTFNSGFIFIDFLHPFHSLFSTEHRAL